MKKLFGNRKVTTEASHEWDRIRDIPRVSEYDGSEVEWLHLMPEKFHLFDLQAQALACIQKHRGLLGNIPVGFGKTLIAWLASVVLQAKRPVIFMPANMVEAFRDEVNKFRHAFRRGIRDPEILSYNKLSSKRETDILERLRPDLIVFDEAHTLRNPDSSRTRRFERYMEANPSTMVVVMTGTLIDKKVSDLRNLAKYALGMDKTFIPNDDHAFNIWSRCVDLDGIPATSDWPMMREFVQNEGFDFNFEDTVEHKKKIVRYAVANRLFTTPGVIGTEEASVDTPLYLHSVSNVPVPATIVQQIETLEIGGTTPDGDDIILEDAQLARVGKTLSLGFYTRWAWERIGGRNEDWLLARKVWGRELRRELKEFADVGYDSPALVRERSREVVLKAPAEVNKKPLWQAYRGWMPQEVKPEPPTVAMWEDPFLFHWLSEWLSQQTRPTIVWYESTAVAEGCAAIGLPVYGAGTLKPKFDGRHVACSIKVHGTGKNLQEWSQNLVLESPSSNKTWEQLIGRTHRRGQEAPRVDVFVLTHTAPLAKCLNDATKDADYTEDITRCVQRLRIATREG